MSTGLNETLYLNLSVFYLTFINSGVAVVDPLEDEDPVNGLCRVEDLKPVVGRENLQKILHFYSRNLQL
jgi:hypothetical protein